VKKQESYTLSQNDFKQWEAGGGSRRGDAPPPETYKSNFIRHDFVQFGKQYSRIKAILSSNVLPQQCCSVYCIFLTVAKPLCDLTTTYYWNRPHLHCFFTAVLFSILHLSYSSEAVMWLNYDILLKAPPLTLLPGSAHDEK